MAQFHTQSTQEGLGATSGPHAPSSTPASAAAQTWGGALPRPGSLPAAPPAVVPADVFLQQLGGGRGTHSCVPLYSFRGVGATAGADPLSKILVNNYDYGGPFQGCGKETAAAMTRARMLGFLEGQSAAAARVAAGLPIDVAGVLPGQGPEHPGARPDAAVLSPDGRYWAAQQGAFAVEDPTATVMTVGDRVTYAVPQPGQEFARLGNTVLAGAAGTAALLGPPGPDGRVAYDSISGAPALYNVTHSSLFLGHEAGHRGMGAGHHAAHWAVDAAGGRTADAIWGAVGTPNLPSTGRAGFAHVLVQPHQ